MLTIVVPMAGRGSRFADAGYELPKPLIPVHGVPMIQVVVENLRPSRPHRFVFLVLEEHLHVHDVSRVLREVAQGCDIVPISQVTQGAAETVLLAGDRLGADPVMIANTDQWVDASIDDYLAAGDGADGLIMTMTANDPKWSFVGRDDAGRVDRVVEKEVISDEATVGIYNFRSGLDFADAARAMIAADERVNGEFYVAPVYNRLIRQGADIRTHNVGREGDGMYGLGIPADLDAFLAHEASRKAASPDR